MEIADQLLKKLQLENNKIMMSHLEDIMNLFLQITEEAPEHDVEINVGSSSPKIKVNVHHYSSLDRFPEPQQTFKRSNFGGGFDQAIELHKTFERKPNNNQNFRSLCSVSDRATTLFISK
jgi:hypothetical protein